MFVTIDFIARVAWALVIPASVAIFTIISSFVIAPSWLMVHTAFN
jgi:hypothetical protein